MMGLEEQYQNVKVIGNLSSDPAVLEKFQACIKAKDERHTRAKATAQKEGWGFNKCEAVIFMIDGKYWKEVENILVEAGMATREEIEKRFINIDKETWDVETFDAPDIILAVGGKEMTKKEFENVVLNLAMKDLDGYVIE